MPHLSAASLRARIENLRKALNNPTLLNPTQAQALKHALLKAETEYAAQTGKVLP